MIAYLDTSALLPLIVEEPGSERAGRVWDAAEHVVSVRLVYAEARAALAQAARIGRLPAGELPGAVAALDELYDQLALIHVDDALVRRRVSSRSYTPCAVTTPSTSPLLSVSPTTR